MASGGIKSTARFVENEQRRTADHGDGHGELSLRPAGVADDFLVSILLYSKKTEKDLGSVFNQGCAFGFSGFGKFGSGSEKPESARVSVGQAVNLSSEFSGNSGIRVPE